jgi:hypothetical protein
VPGRVEECPCVGGTTGVQACLDDGSGFGACECPVQTGATSGGGGEDQLRCGNGVCLDEGENCHTCSLDCGECDPCTLAPSCANAQIPPVAMDHANLDVAFEYVPASAVRARLEHAIASGDLGVRVIAAALSDETPSENPVVTIVRKALAEHPTAAAAARRGLERAGLHQPKLYSADLPPLLPTYSTMGGEFPGGTMECGSPLLRLRVAQITVHEEDDDWDNDIVYCSISSEAMNGSEIRVTPQTPPLDEGESFAFSIEAGVMWGQLGPTTPGGNMLITYDCFESDSDTGYQDLISAIGGAAGQIGGAIGGEYGWVFTTVGAVAGVISSAMSLDGDDHLFNATQTIPLEMQLDLTNGRYWSVRRSGTHFLSDWDWELRVEAWGCAEYGTL